MTGLKVARLWSRLDEQGVPVLDVAISRRAPTTPTNAILAFLSGGSEVMRASGLGKDWLAPGHPETVPIGFRTDGTWLWSDELPYYVRAHGIVPEPDLLSHMRRHGFKAAEADASAIEDAEEMLKGEIG